MPSPHALTFRTVCFPSCLRGLQNKLLDEMMTALSISGSNGERVKQLLDGMYKKVPSAKATRANSVAKLSQTCPL